MHVVAGGRSRPEGRGQRERERGSVKELRYAPGWFAASLSVEFAGDFPMRFALGNET